MQDFDYNTQRQDIRLKEYGRNVQNISDHIKTIKDDDERLEKAKTLIKLMKMINPAFKENHENEQMMWDHLHIISDFGLDLKDSPFEKPEEEILDKRPEKVPYSTGRIKLRHYGKNVELIVLKIAEETDPERQLAGISRVGKIMKKIHAEIHYDQIEDDVIATQIEEISKGKIKVDLQAITEGNLFYVSKAELVQDIAPVNQKKKVKTKSNNHKKRRR